MLKSYKIKKFDSIINEYYSDEDVDIRILPTKRLGKFDSRFNRRII